MRGGGLDLLTKSPWNRLTAAFRQPAFWLAVQMILVVIVIHLRGWGVVHEVPDTKSYLHTGQAPLAEMLVSIRTIGYPLFLRAVAVVSPGLDLVPQVHLLFHLVAVGLFYRALRRFGAAPWQALAASMGLLWTVIHDPAIQDVASDSLARSMAIVTISCLLYVSASPQRILPWVGLTLSLAAAYQIRPALLFLVPLVPVLGLLFLGLHAIWHGAPFRWKPVAITSVAVAFLPFFGFCLLRWALVGQFGLVAFGGWNLAGIAVEMLDRPLIETRLPAQWRPLALEILEAREKAHRERHLASALKDERIIVAQLKENYDVNLYHAALPVLRKRYDKGKDALTNSAINRDLAALSKAVLLARKPTYLRFVVHNFELGLRDILPANLTLQLYLPAAVFLFFARNLVWPRSSRRPPRADDLQASYVMLLLIALGVLFTLGSVFLIILVQVPLGHYLITSSLFLHSICVLWIFQEVRLIAAEMRLTEGRTNG